MTELNQRPKAYRHPRSYSWNLPVRPVTLTADHCQPWKLIHPNKAKYTCALCGAQDESIHQFEDAPASVLLTAINASASNGWADGIDLDPESEIRVCQDCLEELNIHPCVECGEWIFARDMPVDLGDNRWIHNDCVESSRWRHCADCGVWFEADRYPRRNCDGDTICESCSEHYFTCDNCGDVVHEDHVCSSPDGDGTYCEDCFDREFTTCHECGEYVRNNDTYSFRGEEYCESCYNDLDRVSCTRCGEDLDPENDEIVEYDGDSYCQSCARRHVITLSNTPANTLHDYNMKPTPIFHAHADCAETRPLYMGIELEICSARGEQDSTLDLIGERMTEDYLYNKYDGSLTSGRGIEMVSHPCTLEYHSQNFGWQKLLADLTEAKATSHDAGCCGLHVHVSRTFFTDADACKLGAFIYSNFRSDGGAINALARRSPGQWCYSGDENKNACINNWPHRDHHDAVNYSNQATIEIRCAKGTLRAESFFAWLEFVDAACRWVGEVSLDTATSENAWSVFSNWVREPVRAARYANLINYMASKHV